MHESRYMRRGFASLAALGLVILMTACSATSKPDPSQEGSLSLSAAADEAYRCLADKGWDVTITWDGGVGVDSTSIPDAQYGLYEADSQECWGQIDARITSMSSDQIARVYDLEVATVDCLTTEGFNVDPPPSRQAYIDSFQTNRWSAYATSSASPGTLSESEWRAINESCPQPAWDLGATEQNE